MNANGNKKLTMTTPEKIAPAKFGTLLGLAPGNVPVYSSDYPSVDDTQLPDRSAYRSYLDGIFMGYKWQCVELARRWLYLNKGYIFDGVAMAYDIFQLRSVRVVKDNTLLPLHSFRNGAKRPPEPGCLLVWDEGGDFEDTGHVAVVTEVHADCIRFVEQNVEQLMWPPRQRWSRELKATRTPDDGYWIDAASEGATILGWVMQTAHDAHSVRWAIIDPRLFNPRARQVADHGQARQAWLDVRQPDEAAYVESMHGHKLTSNDADQYRYFRLSETAHKEIKHATNELHAMFMHATHQVLQDDALLAKFDIPPAIWPKIHQSWNNRRNQMITGRLDFSVSERGIKVYEYNADSASCHLETGKIQQKWAAHFGASEGRCPGDNLHQDLIDAWRESGVDSVLHIMQDSFPEETYHALYMKSAIEAAGICCKIIEGFAGLAWDDDGYVVDADGVRIMWVWKTWAWETALDQLRAECDEDAQQSAALAFGERRTAARRNAAPRLADVLLRPEVMVFEPLWTLIPSNKAILPVLWSLFPDHPYLLNSQYELTDELRASGYVSKPIAGRCGSNISIVDANSTVVEETAGRFHQQNNIYQQLFPLPRIDDHNVQVCTFSVDGRYAGACVRVDPSLVITDQSNLLALRIVDDASVELDQ